MTDEQSPDHTAADGEPQRRRFARHALCAAARLEPLNENPHLDEAFGVALQNIARTGVMFHAPQPLQPGSTWRLTFSLHDHRIGSVALAIRYCQPAPGGYHIGAQFIIEPFILDCLGVQCSGDDVDTAWDVSEMFQPH